MTDEMQNQPPAESDEGPAEILVRQSGVELPPVLPLMGIDGAVLFPFMIAPLVITLDPDKQLVDDVVKGDRLMGVFLKRDSSEPDSFANLHEAGCLAVVLKMLRMPDGGIRILLHGIERIRIAEAISDTPYLRARTERLDTDATPSRTVLAMTKSIQALVIKIVELGHLPKELASVVMEIADPAKLADLAVSHLAVKVDERQEVLATADLEKRLELVLKIVAREADLLELGTQIQTKVSSQMDKNQRDYMLREQMKAIRTELGEEEGKSPDIEGLIEQLKKAQLPAHAREVAEKELKRLEMTHPSSPEYTVSRNYLDWILALPWNKRTRDNMDIRRAREVLDTDHYALDDIKERILEYLAVIQLKKRMRGPILCFVGPPGVGKTSLGMSIARALGRKFYRMSLGGMRDEAEIRGHRRTYVGALPGRIIKGLKDCGSCNPLIMLDEIDKLGADFRGDPASALLEVLDPEQNSTFTDHYLDMQFDLSAVMFITTANLLDTIPSPLQDRMEILRLSGYTTREKLEIAKRYLVPRTYENTGVAEKNVRFMDKGLLEIVEGFTREAGVRNLEREIGNICRKVAKRIAEGQHESVTVGPTEVIGFLGPRRIFKDLMGRAGLPGVAVGLAWTQTGGETLFVEVNAVPGKGDLLLTGQLGDVMKESAMAAMSFLHANADQLGVPERAFSKQNFHLHVPAGATPKDGPSAGVTIAAAIASLLTGSPVKERLAMTGEVTLKGTVLPVGGIKEKVLAAHRFGIREIILPSHCRNELEKDVPKEVLSAIKFHFVDHIVDVFRVAFPGMKHMVAAGTPAVPPPEEPETPQLAPIFVPIPVSVPMPAAAAQHPAHGRPGREPVRPAHEIPRPAAEPEEPEPIMVDHDREVEEPYREEPRPEQDETAPRRRPAVMLPLEGGPREPRPPLIVEPGTDAPHKSRRRRRGRRGRGRTEQGAQGFEEHPTPVPTGAESETEETVGQPPAPSAPVEPERPAVEHRAEQVASEFEDMEFGEGPEEGEFDEEEEAEKAAPAQQIPAAVTQPEAPAAKPAQEAEKPQAPAPEVQPPWAPEAPPAPAEPRQPVTAEPEAAKAEGPARRRSTHRGGRGRKPSKVAAAQEFHATPAPEAPAPPAAEKPTPPAAEKPAPPVPEKPAPAATAKPAPATPRKRAPAKPAAEKPEPATPRKKAAAKTAAPAKKPAAKRAGATTTSRRKKTGGDDTGEK